MNPLPWMMPVELLVKPALRANVPPELTLMMPSLLKLVPFALSVPPDALRVPPFVNVVGWTANVLPPELASMVPLLVSENGMDTLHG